MIFNNILIIFSSGFIFVPNMVREILNLFDQKSKPTILCLLTQITFKLSF